MWITQNYTTQKTPQHPQTKCQDKTLPLHQPAPHIKRIALKNFLERSVKKRIVFDPDSSGEFIRFSVTEGNSSNSFRVHASFRSFLTLRKEQLKISQEFNPLNIGINKSKATIK